MEIDFKPKFFEALRNYSKEKFAADLMAGIIVGIVALPLAIAFGIASGVSPEKGLITAVIGGFIVSLLGGSSVQIGGPTGAFIVIVYGIIQQFGLEGLAVATAMAGVMLVLMGLLRLGVVIRFIPYPIVIGFTSGIALTIFTTQVGDFLGLGLRDVPADFLSKWAVYFQHLSSAHLWTAAVGMATIVVIALMPRLSKKVPGSLVAIVVMTVGVYLLQTYAGVQGIETIGDRFSISSSLPAPEGFSLSMETINLLMPAAFTIAMLGAIESLLSATVADGVTGERHNSNTELMAQGVANIVVPFFGGIPVTGAIARTMTNINNGGRTAVAGIIHAVVLLLVLLFLGNLTRYIPMAALAGVLMVVAYNMSGWRTVRSLLRGPKSDVLVMSVTFFLTVIFNLTIAIEIGMLMAIFVFVKRVSETTHIAVLRDRLDTRHHSDVSPNEDDKMDLAPGVEVYEIDGPFFFGIANKFDDLMRRMGDNHPDAESPLRRFHRRAQPGNAHPVLAEGAHPHNPLRGASRGAPDPGAHGHRGDGGFGQHLPPYQQGGASCQCAGAGIGPSAGGAAPSASSPSGVRVRFCEKIPCLKRQGIFLSSARRAGCGRQGG